MSDNLEYITRPEHEEFKERVNSEENRQNHRLDVIEGRVDKLIDMQASLAVLQAGIDSISGDMKRVSAEIDALKQEPANKWNKAVWIVVTAIITAAVTFAMSNLF